MGSKHRAMAEHVHDTPLASEMLPTDQQIAERSARVAGAGGSSSAGKRKGAGVRTLCRASPGYILEP